MFCFVPLAFLSSAPLGLFPTSSLQFKPITFFTLMKAHEILNVLVHRYAAVPGHLSHALYFNFEFLTFIVPLPSARCTLLNLARILAATYNDT